MTTFLCLPRNLPTPGTGEPGVLGIIPSWTEAGSPDLSGGPPGAERGTRSVGTATVDDQTTFYLHNPLSPDSSSLWDWYMVLTLLVWVCYLTQKCVSWSQPGSSSRSHIYWGSHWHGSQSHPSLSDLCIDCIVLLLPSFLQMYFLNAHWCAVPCPGLGVIWGRTGVASSSYSRTSITFKTKQFQKIKACFKF